jgi:hypothetical protein
VVLTDGGALDLNELESLLSEQRDSFLLVLLMGYGRDHDDSLRDYRRMAEHCNVRIVDLASIADPQLLVDTVRKQVASALSPW